MIVGQVTPAKEAVLQLVVRGPSGAVTVTDAILDTGFTEQLTLPASVIRSLGLRRRGSMRLILADGSQVVSGVYRAIVDWDGQPRHVDVQETNSDALIGMSMIYGHRLLLDAVDGGQVTIGPLP